jgi:hypothetical protein
VKTFIELAEEAAVKLQQDSGGNMEKEFIAWLHVALQREAMVAVAYQEDRVRVQLEKWANTYSISSDVVEIILRALVAVWAQESAHREYFEAMFKAIDPPRAYMEEIKTMLENIQGQIEGDVLSNAQSPTLQGRIKAKIAIVVGKMMGKVPAYVEGLHNASFSKYCSVNAELEQTAVSGYSRMIEIARLVPRASFMQDTPVIYDLRKTLADETYHEALFLALSEWPPDPTPAGTGPTLSPLGPAAASSPTMTVADARNLLAEARYSAYESDAASHAAKVVAINYEVIANDPVILHMRSAVHAMANKANKDEDNYLTAGA